MSLGTALCSVGLSTLGACMVHWGVGPEWPGWVAFTVGLIVGLQGVGVRSLT